MAAPDIMTAPQPVQYVGEGYRSGSAPLFQQELGLGHQEMVEGDPNPTYTRIMLDTVKQICCGSKSVHQLLLRVLLSLVATAWPGSQSCLMTMREKDRLLQYIETTASAATTRSEVNMKRINMENALREWLRPTLTRNGQLLQPLLDTVLSSGAWPLPADEVEPSLMQALLQIKSLILPDIEAESILTTISDPHELPPFEEIYPLHVDKKRCSLQAELAEVMKFSVARTTPPRLSTTHNVDADLIVIRNRSELDRLFSGPVQSMVHIPARSGTLELPARNLEHYFDTINRRLDLDCSIVDSRMPRLAEATRNGTIRELWNSRHQPPGFHALNFLDLQHYGRQLPRDLVLSLSLFDILCANPKVQRYIPPSLLRPPPQFSSKIESAARSGATGLSSIISGAGAISPVHFDVAGTWILVMMITGSKYWLFERKQVSTEATVRHDSPMEMDLDSDVPSSKVVADLLEEVPEHLCSINLTAGHSILQPPGMRHSVLTHEMAYAVCFQFYHPHTMHLSIDAVTAQILCKRLENESILPDHLHKLGVCVGFIRTLELPSSTYSKLDDAVVRMLERLDLHKDDEIKYPRQEHRAKLRKCTTIGEFPGWIQHLYEEYGDKKTLNCAYWISLWQFISIASAYLVQGRRSRSSRPAFLRSVWMKAGLRPEVTVQRKTRSTGSSAFTDDYVDGGDDFTSEEEMDEQF